MNDVTRALLHSQLVYGDDWYVQREPPGHRARRVLKLYVGGEHYELAYLTPAVLSLQIECGWPLLVQARGLQLLRQLLGLDLVVGSCHGGDHPTDQVLYDRSQGGWSPLRRFGSQLLGRVSPCTLI